jgi:hypothetical protein
VQLLCLHFCIVLAIVRKLLLQTDLRIARSAVAAPFPVA